MTMASEPLKVLSFFLKDVQDCPFPLIAAGLYRVHQEDQS